MKQIDTIRAALEMATGGRPSNIAAAQEALAALAELEKAAADPVAWVIGKPTHGHEIGRYLAWNAGHVPHSVGSAAEPLYAAPPAPVAEIREVAVTDEMCERAYIGKWRGVPELIGHEPDDEDRQWSREWLEAWRTELGPALGMVELKEPTPEECERICTEYERLLMREGTCGGRDAFDAVRAVMWPKEGL